MPVRFKKNEFADVRLMRLKKGMDQRKFWNRIGLTQSAGSRYELRNRRLPDTVKALLVIAHGTDAQAKRVIERLRLFKRVEFY